MLAFPAETLPCDAHGKQYFTVELSRFPSEGSSQVAKDCNKSDAREFNRMSASFGLPSAFDLQLERSLTPNGETSDEKFGCGPPRKRITPRCTSFSLINGALVQLAVRCWR